MKKYIAALTMVIGLGVTAYGQGTIVFDNFNNANSGADNTGASTAGLVYTNGGVGHIGKVADNVGFSVWAGADAGSMSLIATFTSLAGGGTWWDYGQFTDPALATKTISAIPSKGSGSFEIQMWYDPKGLFNTYSNAVAGGAMTGQVIFQNATGGGTTPPTSFTGMPALVLSAVPEPATFAIVGLGSAALLVFRRRRIK